jgi:dihydroxyacid dehydratase/phosphogluconate dehydratase
MDELIEQVSSRTGVDPAIARRAVGIIFKFLLREGREGKVQELIKSLPGAEDAVASAPDIGGGVMGVFNTLTSAGLGMGDIQGVTREVIAFANAKVGEDAVREIVGSIPGLNQFV